MKTVIIAHWHAEDEYEVYSSLKGFTERHPSYNLETLNYHISRKKQPYEGKEVTLRRVQVIGRA